MVVYCPDCKKFGPAAPFVRNSEIIENSDIVYAFWDGRSNHTRDALNKAEKLGQIIYIFKYNQQE